MRSTFGLSRSRSRVKAGEVLSCLRVLFSRPSDLWLSPLGLCVRLVFVWAQRLRLSRRLGSFAWHWLRSLISRLSFFLFFFLAQDLYFRLATFVRCSRSSVFVFGSCLRCCLLACNVTLLLGSPHASAFRLVLSVLSVCFGLRSCLLVFLPYGLLARGLRFWLFIFISTLLFVSLVVHVSGLLTTASSMAGSLPVWHFCFRGDRLLPLFYFISEQTAFYVG